MATCPCTVACSSQEMHVSSRYGRRRRGGKMAQEHAVPWPGEAAKRQVRGALSATPHALLCDADGTLSAIAPTPEAATLLPDVAELLVRALSCFELVAVISGRSASDVRRLVGVPGVLYIGNHGLEQLAVSAADGHM